MAYQISPQWRVTTEYYNERVENKTMEVNQPGLFQSFIPSNILIIKIIYCSWSYIVKIKIVILSAAILSAICGSWQQNVILL